MSLLFAVYGITASLVSGMDDFEAEDDHFDDPAPLDQQEFTAKQSSTYQVLKAEGAAIAALRKEQISDKVCFENSNHSDECKASLNEYLRRSWDHWIAKQEWCTSNVDQAGIRKTIALDTEAYCDFALSYRAAKYGFATYSVARGMKYAVEVAGNYVRRPRTRLA